MAKKKKVSALAAKPPQVREETWFEQDPEPFTTPTQKNDFLADLMSETWNQLQIVTIRRLEIGAPGWEATYRS